MDLPIKMTESRFHDLNEESIGLCLECGDERECTEPDADGYRCGGCGAMKVQGVELALVSGNIEITEEEVVDG